jgi:hypothetical protein
VALPSSFLGAHGWRWLKTSGALLLASVVLYVVHDPIGGRSGDSAVGYALGVVSALLILWLLWFGVRKRSYASRGTELQGWLSAHVWLGVTLLLLVPLHSAFQFGWNVHTLAYALLVVVVVSGICGVIAYASLPQLMTRNRGGRRFDAFLEEIADVDADCRNLAGDLPDTVTRAVAVAIDETRIGGGLLVQLSGRDRRCGTARALAELGRIELTGEGRERMNRLIELLSRKSALLETLRRDLRHQALLDLWLLVHVPLSVGLLAAVSIHVFSVFWYW